MTVRFSFNDEVRVRLTDRGRTIYRDHYADLERRLGFKVECPADDGGWSTFHFWRLMKIFGLHTGLGLAPPFEMTAELVSRD